MPQVGTLGVSFGPSEPVGLGGNRGHLLDVIDQLNQLCLVRCFLSRRRAQGHHNGAEQSHQHLQNAAERRLLDLVHAIPAGWAQSSGAVIDAIANEPRQAPWTVRCES